MSKRLFGSSAEQSANVAPQKNATDDRGGSYTAAPPYVWAIDLMHEEFEDALQKAKMLIMQKQGYRRMPKNLTTDFWYCRLLPAFSSVAAWRATGWRT